MTTIAIFGAAGKMGTQISNRLRDHQDFTTLFVEAGGMGVQQLKERGDEPTPPDIAAGRADIIILAVPDPLIEKVAGGILQQMQPDSMLVMLDPAVPHSGMMPIRKDISIFICHPTHPPPAAAGPEVEPFAVTGTARTGQHVVAALMQGPEADFARGEEVARAIFAPVMNVYRLTVEQMVILGPALSEMVVLTSMVVAVEGIEEAVRRGIPREAATEFIIGHINANIPVLFKLVDAELPDRAKLAVARARDQIFKPDWKKIFEPESIMEEVRAITQGITVK